MATIDCCGCHLVSDYGTSLVTGDGSDTNPFSVSQIDPTFTRPVVRVRRDAGGTQTIPNNTDTAITYNTSLFDTDGMWSVGNPTRLTFKRAGLYLFGTDFRWVGSTAVRETWFRMNGITELDRKSGMTPGSVDYAQSMQYQWFFSVNDYIETMVFQTSGGNLNIYSDATVTIYSWAMYLGRKI